MHRKLRHQLFADLTLKPLYTSTNNTRNGFHCKQWRPERAKRPPERPQHPGQTRCMASLMPSNMNRLSPALYRSKADFRDSVRYSSPTATRTSLSATSCRMCPTSRLSSQPSERASSLLMPSLTRVRRDGPFIFSHEPGLICYYTETKIEMCVNSRSPEPFWLD